MAPMPLSVASAPRKWKFCAGWGRWETQSRISWSGSPHWKTFSSGIQSKAMIELGQIKVIAAKEFRDRIRNRWVIAVAIIFTLFALTIAYFGSAQQGEVGIHSIEVTIASLVSLVIYLIPLIALILGYDVIVGERERGSLDLLLSMPITRLEPVSYTHLRAHETDSYLVCRLLL